MDSERWDRIQQIFLHVLEVPPLAQGEALRQECGGDEDLMVEVLAMLREDARSASLLDCALPDAVKDLFDKPSALNPLSDFGPYTIIKPLGEGGMGTVYLARREDIGNVVAIKVMRGGLFSPDRRERFAREQKTLAQLGHPLIAQIYDADTLEDGTPWFAMEYVEGEPITEYCRWRACSVDERLRLFRGVCEAVQYAHRQAILHRDLKPSNVLVKADGTVKLLDFGIAKQLQEPDQPDEQTETALRPMTLPYASPEQVRGERLGTQSDVYSLGVILYELLTGKLPYNFVNKSRTEAEQIIVAGTPEAPSAVVGRQSDAPGAGKYTSHLGKAAWGELDVLILTTMHKDVQRRYRSAEALIRDIDHYLKGEPLEARPDSVGYRLDKFIQRNRRALAATAAAVIVMLSLVVFFVVRLARARTAALAEARRTQRIERFMLNLFDGGDKTAGPSDSLRVVTLLGRGVQNARTLNAEPAVQGDLYQTLGAIYQKLGKYDQAEPLMRQALERRKSVAGRDSSDVAESLVSLGLLRLDQGKPEEAERLVREGLALDQQRLGPQNLAVARDESALGQVLEARGAYQEALKTLNETLRLQSEGQEATTAFADTLTELALAHYDLGHFYVAESLHTRALATDRQVYGAIHPRVADDLYNLGAIQHALGHDADAERYYRQALEIKQTWYGNEHPDVGLMMVAVGQSLVFQGRYNEAAPVLQQALAIQERTLGKTHPQVAMGLNVLAVMEMKRGHLSDAEKDFTRMADIYRAAYGDGYYLVGIALLNLGDVYEAEKNYARAERSYRGALTRFTAKLPPGHLHTAITQVRLGHTLVLEQQYKEAKSHLLAGYEVLLKQPGEQTNRLQNARKDLITACNALNQPEQARKFQTELAANQAPDTSTTSKH